MNTTSTTSSYYITSNFPQNFSPIHLLPRNITRKHRTSPLAFEQFLKSRNPCRSWLRCSTFAHNEKSDPLFSATLGVGGVSLDDVVNAHYSIPLTFTVSTHLLLWKTMFSNLRVFDTRAV